MRIWHDLHGDADAPFLVLPCSLGTSRELWDPERYAHHFRVLRYEHRGHGASETPPGPYTVEQLAGDALALLDELGVDRASWLGLSLGGMVAMWIAACVPERVERLVLACTSARVPSPQAYAERARVVREQGVGPVADDVVSRWFTAAVPDALRARFREILIETPTEGYAGGCEAVADWDFGERLGEIVAPTLVLAGAEDEAMPAAHTDLLVQRIPGARGAVLEGAAHLANLERPAAFADAALAHLEAA
jgi:3-oxoadipate enol-lactonase